MRYGYARASVTDQDVSIQEAPVKAAGCETVRAEKVGTKRDGRMELEVLLGSVRFGGELAVTRIDRLATTFKDRQEIAHEPQAKGVTLRAMDQAVDTSTSHGRPFFVMLDVFAEFKTNLRRERQLLRISAAKRARVYKRRKPNLDAAEIHRLEGEGVGGLGDRQKTGGWPCGRLPRARCRRSGAQ